MITTCLLLFDAGNMLDVVDVDSEYHRIQPPQTEVNGSDKTIPNEGTAAEDPVSARNRLPPDASVFTPPAPSTIGFPATHDDAVNAHCTSPIAVTPAAKFPLVDTSGRGAAPGVDAEIAHL